MSTNAKVAGFATAGLLLGYALDRANSSPIAAVTLVTVALSIVGLVKTRWLTRYCFDKSKIIKEKEYYRALSYGFFHLNLTHLLFNMLTFYSFAPLFYNSLAVVTHHPALLLIFLYLLSVVVSSIPDLLSSSKEYTALGASGTVSSLISACVVLQPSIKMYLFFLPVPIPAPLFLVAFIALSYYLSGRQSSRIGHRMHLTGAVFGIILGMLIRLVM